MSPSETLKSLHTEKSVIVDQKVRDIVHNDHEILLLCVLVIPTLRPVFNNIWNEIAFFYFLTSIVVVLA